VQKEFITIWLCPLDCDCYHVEPGSCSFIKTSICILTLPPPSSLLNAHVYISISSVSRACRIVKLSSPYLNVVINIGAIFFYVDVILFGVDENIAPFSTVDILCQVIHHQLSLSLRKLICTSPKIYWYSVS